MFSNWYVLLLNGYDETKDFDQQRVECDLAILNSKLKLEHSMKEVVTRQKGQPKKQIQVVLLTPKIKKPKGLTSKKVNRKYKNWFKPSFWDPIYATMKQQSNLTIFFSLLTIEIQFFKKHYQKKKLLQFDQRLFN